MENRAKTGKMLRITGCVGAIFPVPPKMLEPLQFHISDTYRVSQKRVPCVN